MQFNKFPNWYARWVLNCAPQFNSLGRDHLYSPPRFPSFFASLTFPPATRARRRRRGGSYLSLFLPPFPSFTRFNFLSIEGASLSLSSLHLSSRSSQGALLIGEVCHVNHHERREEVYFSFKPKSLTADIQTTYNLTRRPGNIYKYFSY